MPADLSVLMPVHAAADVDHLAEALDSIALQSVRPQEVVVVLDGPVSAHHEAVLVRHPDLRVLRLPVNVGSGLARQHGLASCTSTWVAQADSDDVSLPDRFERQLEVLERSGADVCTGTMTEFATAGDKELGTRPVPRTHGEFARLMPYRNPINHPATVFRRTSALDAGSYQHLPYLEDYDLWARMLAGGAVFVGVEEPVVRFRTDGMLARRTSIAALHAERDLQRRLRHYGIIGRLGYVRNRALRTTYLRLPPPVLEIAYRVVFRRRTHPQVELTETHRSNVA